MRFHLQDGSYIFLSEEESQEAIYEQRLSDMDAFPNWEELQDNPERFVSESDYESAVINDIESLANDWESFEGFNN